MVELQSVDFSRKIKSRPAPAPTGIPAADRSTPSAGQGRTASGRLLGYGVAAALLIFAAGLYSGIKIGQFKSFEQSLLKYPDGNPPAAQEGQKPQQSLNSFANRPQQTAEKEGLFIIKVGTFSEDRARELQGILESRPEMQELRTLKCKSVSSDGALHQSIFRTEVQDARLQNLFFGCFSTVDTAGEALEELSKLNIAGTGSARVFEIDGK